MCSFLGNEFTEILEGQKGLTLKFGGFILERFGTSTILVLIDSWHGIKSID